MSDWRALDELARALARPTSRSRAVRVVAGAVIGAAMGGRHVSAAAASTIVCKEPQPVPCTCGGKFNLCCSTRDRCDCYPDRAVCTVIPCKPGESDYGVVCCKPGETFDSVTAKCVCAEPCGSTCCTPKQTCVKGVCCPNTRVCGSTCCTSGKTCTFKKGAAGGRGCCPADRVVRRKLSGRSVKFCCPPGTVKVTVPSSNGSVGCCPPGDRNCCGDPLDELAPLGPNYAGPLFCVRGKATFLM